MKAMVKMNTEKLIPVLPVNIYQQLDDIIQKFDINTPLRLAHLLAQCKQETNFIGVTENLHYTAERLREVFPYKFEDKPKLADELVAKGQQAIADYIYDLKELGNTQPNDGYYFRGRGCIGITGRDLYTRFDKVVDDDILSKPDLVATKYPFFSSAWYFQQFCLRYADMGATDAACDMVTKHVNKASLGKENRRKFFYEFYNLLTK